MSVTINEIGQIMIEFNPNPVDKFLGKGVIDGRHVADLWFTHSGLLVALDPGTILVSRNPDASNYWQRKENGEWHPVEMASDAQRRPVGGVQGMER